MSPIFRGGGRYVGGDLVTQIAERAQTIQIVRVVHRMPIGADSRGATIYAFQFEVIETLAQRRNGLAPGPFSLDGYERIRSVPTHDGFRTRDEGEIWLSPEALDRPGGADGYFILQTPGPEHPSRSSCDLPMYVELGEEFVVLRQSNGRLYAFDRFLAPGDHDEQDTVSLPIYYSYHASSRNTRSSSAEVTVAPPLVRIESRQDAFLVRLRAALANVHRLRR
ncbi:MAG: hypothetical protein NT015_06145 [Alphaproteobacteria bacterium]|nr:hypothetical protein [Alphaproteobacteria bacterium]